MDQLISYYSAVLWSLNIEASPRLAKDKALTSGEHYRWCLSRVGR